MIKQIFTALLMIALLPQVAVASAGLTDPAPRQSAQTALRDRLTVLAYHDVREDIKRNYAADQNAMSAQNLAMQFAWLHDNGYHVVSLQQVLDALNGKRPLLPKSVLLTFDDGLQSVYTTVLPLLRIFNYPAVISIVTAWIESDVEVVYENHLLSSRDFLTWNQLRELRETGLIEIVSHTHDLHHGIQGNPQGNEEPAAVTRRYADGYENRDDYLQRIEKDLADSAALLEQRTGRAPRAVVWPYGRYNSDLRNLAALHGMQLSFSLDDADQLDGFAVLGRELMMSNPGVDRFAEIFLAPEQPLALRAAQVDLDYVYDPDPAMQEANLGMLLDRIKALGISHVFLQAFADPDGDGAADALYFPNRHLPMRADLFNRAAWQLQTRANVSVYAWMPITAFSGAAILPEWQLLQSVGAQPAVADPDSEPRLSVFVPAARQFIRDIYADLGTYAPINGIHFHDDGRMNEFEDANPAALAAYRAVYGADFSIAGAEQDPQLLSRWSDFKTAALIDFTLELQAAVAAARPGIKTSRNMFASALLDDRGTVYLAQNFAAFLASYNYVTIMAMPMLEDAPDAPKFYAALLQAVSKQPGAMQRTVFQLQTVDWRNGYELLASDELRKQMRSLQSQGVRNLAYYPDDFLQNHPNFDQLRQGISLATQPVMP